MENSQNSIQENKWFIFLRGERFERRIYRCHITPCKYIQYHCPSNHFKISQVSILIIIIIITIGVLQMRQQRLKEITWLKMIQLGSRKSGLESLTPAQCLSMTQPVVPRASRASRTASPPGKIWAERNWARTVGTETATHNTEEVRRQDKPGLEPSEPKEHSDLNRLGDHQAGEQSKLESITCARGQCKVGVSSQAGNSHSRLKTQCYPWWVAVTERRAAEPSWKDEYITMTRIESARHKPWYRDKKEGALLAHWTHPQGPRWGRNCRVWDWSKQSTPGRGHAVALGDWLRHKKSLVGVMGQMWFILASLISVLNFCFNCTLIKWSRNE